MGFQQYGKRFSQAGRLGVLGLAVMLLLGGCSKQQAAKPAQVVDVKAMQVIQQDTPVTYEFVGEIEAKDEVQVRSKVSGTIVAKLASGGTTVRKGQPLFEIDRRQYESALINNQAQEAEASASLSRMRRDVARYQQLASQDAVAQQVLDNALAEERQGLARVNAQSARVQQALNDLDDTVIVSPLDGRIDVKDLSVGNYVQAGQTVVATISSVDPVRVKFSISENDYLRFFKLSSASGSSPAEPQRSVKLRLSDGSEYPLEGMVEQVDRGLSQDTGALIVKAAFPNPQHLLVPGMFARVVAVGEVRPGALLVPQRAVQEMLGKTFITVIADGKAESRPVKMGPRVGNLWMVDEGLTAADVVVVEGFQKTPPGTPVNVTMMTLADLKIPERK